MMRKLSECRCLAFGAVGFSLNDVSLNSKFRTREKMIRVHCCLSKARGLGTELEVALWKISEGPLHQYSEEESKR
jgi:hypothetical protein